VIYELNISRKFEIVSGFCNALRFFMASIMVDPDGTEKEVLSCCQVCVY
jgi:hypothetical protein